MFAIKRQLGFIQVMAAALLESCQHAVRTEEQEKPALYKQAAVQLAAAHAAWASKNRPWYAKLLGIEHAPLTEDQALINLINADEVNIGYIASGQADPFERTKFEIDNRYGENSAAIKEMLAALRYNRNTGPVMISIEIAAHLQEMKEKSIGQVNRNFGD